jgi:hypothetical protein
MITLCIRYTFNPDKVADLRTYVEEEQSAIERSGGKIVGYFLPTDFAGPTNGDRAHRPAVDGGLCGLPETAGGRPDHKKNIARLQESGAGVAMNRSFIQRVEART